MKNSQEIVVFNSSQSENEFQIILDGDNETVWVTEKQIIELFGKARRNIGEHINNIYDEGELDKSSTWREFRQVQKEGQREVSRKVQQYNLDVVISVGYRVKSQTVFGELAYPTIEEQSAQILYSIIKGHAFSEGNKRIVSFIFVWFLEQNNFHLKQNRQPKISDNTLVALALAVAQSIPDKREIITKLIINLIKN